MDERCKTVLLRMKLSHLIGVFEEKQIDYETLQLFHEFPDTIPLIISNVSDQLKFRKRMKLILEENEDTREHTIETIGDNTEIILPSTSLNQSSEILEPSSSTYDIITLGIETTTGKKLCLEQPQYNDLTELKDPPNNVHDQNTSTNVNF